MNTAYIIDAVRTPVGKYGGSLSSIRPDDMLAHVIRALITRNPGLDVNHVEDVIAGDANQAGEDCRNVARMAALLAGLPATVAGNTVNRLCASGLQAIMDCSRAIACGEGDIYIAGGVESMTRAPFVMAKPSGAWTRTQEMMDTTIGWRFTNPRLSELYHPYNMGETAENVASRWNISRSEQDEYAFNSHDKFFNALEAGKWKEEIAAIEISGGNRSKNPISVDEHQRNVGIVGCATNGKSLFSVDEHPRRTSIEKLNALNPAFIKNGTVTAGNSSGLNDGSAAMLLAGEEAVKKYGFKPLARVVSMAVAGVDPSIMGIGPVPASQKALKRAGLSLSDIGLVELNESFASQSIACIKELELDAARVNVNGGSIAIGHPLGCSGVRISTTLLYEMKRRGARYGLACMCVGVGQGAAVIYENLS